MGAGGSTAASCSSLDIANHKQQYRHHQQLLLLQQEQRCQKYNRKQYGLKSPSYANNNSGCKLKQSSSHFDLSRDYRAIATNDSNANMQQHLQPRASGAWFDTNQSEAYSLSNANFGVARPVLVLPPPPSTSSGSKQHVSPLVANHQRNHLNVNNIKKNNAGVASRIQRQQDISKELKKFSDSLPSLNNLHDLPSQQQQHRKKPKSHAKQYKMPQTNGSSTQHHLPTAFAGVTPSSDYLRHLHLHQNEQSSSPNNKSAKFMHGNKEQLFIDLVEDNSQQSRQHWPASPPIALSYHDAVPVSRQLMKRATSLSSLHNLHSHHQSHQHQHHHDNHNLQQQQLHLTYFDNEQQSPVAGNRGISHSSRQQLVSNSKSCNVKQHSHHNNRQTENIHRSSCDLRQQPMAKTPTNQQISNNKLTGALYSQPSNPLTKRMLKFKQVTKASGQSSKKYKQKQQQQLKQQQKQNGCPVLPPLPRSQSLHELIRLRATENGQRMRTTGTLRGPLATNSDGNKVNLVAELLENRRQQKMNEDQTVAEATVCVDSNSTETMTSQSSSTCSSTDDGIHDVSLSVDQSTGDSRSTARVNKSQQNIAKQTSVESHQQSGKQRLFKKNTQQNATPAYSHKRFSQQPNAIQHGEQSSRSHNQKLDSSDEYYKATSKQVGHKSTLKRSLSHSALQSDLASLNLESSNNDGNESDDLNELAKFLYQFKQRQLAANSDSGEGPIVSAATQEKRQDLNPNSHLPEKLSGSGNNSSAHSRAANLQQSPNSTTSSSGFASSTCTTNSITSYAFDEINTSSSQQQNQVQSINSDKSGKKLPSRKKYPAPLRPDGHQVGNAVGEKCVISGKLKLSSSLLSIVDEYNSSLQSNEQCSPKGHPTNLTSVLLGEQRSESNQAIAKKYDDRNKRKDAAKHDHDENDNHPHHEQLERLKRYTELRQMSQSELALSHLIPPSSCSSSLDQRGRQESAISAHLHNSNSSKQPYKSKFINIIRRISDKKEASNYSRDHHQQEPRAIQQSQQESRKPKAINQNEAAAAIVPHANQCAKKQPKYSASNNSSASKSRLASESLCDLNFDCDFELIKNCGAPAQVKQQAGHARQQPAGSLLSCQAGAKLPAVGHKHHQQNAAGYQGEKQQKLVDSSKDERNNNWRLLPASLASLDHKHVDSASGCCNSNGSSSSSGSTALHHKSMNGNATGEKDCRLINVQKQTIDKPSAAASKQPTKLKWSAGGWLMNMNSSIGGNGNSSDDATTSKKIKKLTSSKDESAGKCASRLTKLISGNRISNQASSKQLHKLPTANVGSEGSIESRNFAQVNSEANQLLNELDESLDLVSRDCSPYSRKPAALSWWNMADNRDYLTDAQQQARVANKKTFRKGAQHHDIGSSSDSNYQEEEDDSDSSSNDYASINRAMINATFGIDLSTVNGLLGKPAAAANETATSFMNSATNLNSHLSIEAGSPSDSFTFSAPCSPEASPKQTEHFTAVPQAECGAKRSLESHANNGCQVEDNLGQVCESSGALSANKSEDLHAAKGVTYSKTTAPTGEELRNQLITRNDCVCPSCSMTDSHQRTSAIAVKSVATRLPPSASPYYHEMRKSPPGAKWAEIGSSHKAGTKNDQSPGSHTKRHLEGNRCTGMHLKNCTAQQDSEVAPATRGCKVATTSCHHCPSSNRREANYNEDVKLNCCLAVCVSGCKNPVALNQKLQVATAPAGQHQTNTDTDGKNGQFALETGIEKDCGANRNCSACQRPVSIQKQQQQPHQPNCPLVVQLGRPQNGDVTATKRTSDHHHEPSGRQLCHAADCHFANRSSGADRLSAVVKSPICRSNSEQAHVPAPVQISTGTSGSGSHGKQDACLRQRQQNDNGANNQRPLVGRSRNLPHEKPVTKELVTKQQSLLHTAGKGCDATRLGCAGQISLANYHNGARFESPLVVSSKVSGGGCGQIKIKTKKPGDHDSQTTVMANKLDMVDNFILKRKTPNAGLKLHG